MKTPKRIGLSLFDEELKNLINVSAKIFPIPQEYIDTNTNPSNYEYGRIDNAIYRWNGSEWNYIVADDESVDWLDVSNKPTSYPPSEHNHDGLHEHTNKSILDTITQLLIDGWNNAKDHVSDVIKHITGEERTLWNTVSNKADVAHNHDTDYSDIDHTHDYSPSNHDHDITYSKLGHNHDGSYYTESEVNSLLSYKSDVTHGHTDLHNHSNKAILDKVIETDPQASYDLTNLKYVEDIKNGYTEGHSHSNKTQLDIITEEILAEWNSAVLHTSDTDKHITSDERTLWNTVSDKAESVHQHEMGDITGLSLDWSSITNKPLTYPPDVHNHNDSYYTEGEINTLLTGKADSTTVSGHTENTTVHVTQTDKTNWNGKLDTTGGTLTGDLTTNGVLRSPNAWNYWHTPYGYIQFGPANASYAHIYTDRPSFYFNKALLVNGTAVSMEGHTHAYAPTSHTHTPAQAGLGNVSNVKQLPIAGGTMTGILYPQQNTSYTTGQARRIVLSTANPSGGGNGDVWIKYTP